MFVKKCVLGINTLNYILCYLFEDSEKALMLLYVKKSFIMYYLILFTLNLTLNIYLQFKQTISSLYIVIQSLAIILLCIWKNEWSFYYKNIYLMKYIRRVFHLSQKYWITIYSYSHCQTFTFLLLPLKNKKCILGWVAHHLVRHRSIHEMIWKRMINRYILLVLGNDIDFVK